MRRITAFLLMILMITAGCMPCSAEEEQLMKDGVFSYYIIEETAVLVSCEDTGSTVITVPQKLGEYNLVEIEGGAFSLCKSLEAFESDNELFKIHDGVLYKETTLICCPPARTKKTYKVPEFVTEILPCAFFGNTNITEVILNDGINTVPVECFAGCSSLRTVKLGEDITQISDGAFAFCSTLRNINLPESLQKIGVASFYGCSSVLSFELSDNITEIGDMAFSDCISVNEFYIPAGISDVSEWIFSINPNLEKIEVSDNNESFCVVDNILYSKNLEKIVFCPGGYKIEELKVPSGTNIIGRKSFENQKFIKKVVLSDSVTEIESNAFYNAESLVDVTFGKSLVKIGEYAFYSCDFLKDVTVTADVTDVGEGAFDDCISLTLYVADGSLIHDYADYNNVNHRIDPGQAAVPRMHWSQKYIDWAEENGITYGVRDYSITLNREGFSWLLINYYEIVKGKQPEPDDNPFSDTSSPAVLKAYRLGLVKGTYDGIFEPARPITRQELCVALFNMLTIINGEEPSAGELPSFRDDEKIADWARDYVNAAYNNSIITGTPEGYINPEGNATIEEAITMLYNAAAIIEHE